MSIQDIKQESTRIKLDKEYDLFFSFASVDYLAGKYGTLKDALDKLNDPDMMHTVSGEYINLLADFIIALCQNYEDGEIPTKKNVMKNMTFKNAGEIFQAVSVAIVNGMPKADDENPPAK